MTILLSGGGTGGHITPILAVAHELKRLSPDVKIVYVGERGGKFAEVTDGHHAIDEVYTIFAGKFRRYHGESWISRLMDVKTVALNLRDVVFVVLGIVQSWLLLRRICPDVTLLKGGFVGVPVGIAAHALGAPFVTHDSDAMPGLANRLVGRWARKNAVALSTTFYPYPASRSVQVGVLVEPSFAEVDQQSKQEFRHAIGVPSDAVMVLITGGSSGAQRLNVAVREIIEGLLSQYPTLYVVHQTGKGKAGVYSDYSHERLQVLEFMRPMYKYTGAADIVVSRVSGNTMAELGYQRKPVIGVPSPFLAGGHQLKNADRLASLSAIIRVDETAEGTNARQLEAALHKLLTDTAFRAELANNLAAQTIHGAAEKLARLLLETAQAK